MKEALVDINKYTGQLSFVKQVKITQPCDDAKKGAVKIEAVDEEKLVIIKGYLKEALLDFDAELGIGTFDMLRSILNNPSYVGEGSRIEVVTKERRGETEDDEPVVVPESLIFYNVQNQPWCFRLTDPKLLPAQPQWKQKLDAWDVVFKPTKSVLHEFMSKASAFMNSEKYFNVRTDNGDLCWYIGSKGSASHYVATLMESGVSAKLSGELQWPIKQVAEILKLQQDDNMTISITSKGALMISVETEYGKYDYILPVKRT